MKAKVLIVGIAVCMAFATLHSSQALAGGESSVNFSDASLNGDYFCINSGFEPVNYVNGDLFTFQSGVLDKEHFDGHGGFTESAIVSSPANGHLCPFQPSAGTYTVNADGTGSQVDTAVSTTPGCPSGFQVPRDLVVEQGGNRFDFINLEVSFSGFCRRAP